MKCSECSAGVARVDFRFMIHTAICKSICQPSAPHTHTETTLSSTTSNTSARLIVVRPETLAQLAHADQVVGIFIYYALQEVNDDFPYPEAVKPSKQD